MENSGLWVFFIIAQQLGLNWDFGTILFFEILPVILLLIGLYLCERYYIKWMKKNLN